MRVKVRIVCWTAQNRNKSILKRSTYENYTWYVLKYEKFSISSIRNLVESVSPYNFVFEPRKHLLCKFNNGIVNGIQIAYMSLVRILHISIRQTVFFSLHISLRIEIFYINATNGKSNRSSGVTSYPMTSQSLVSSWNLKSRALLRSFVHLGTEL